LRAEWIVLPADPVAVVTAIGRSFNFTPGVAVFAVCRKVSAFERKGSCLVKGPGCIPEAGRRVAVAAVRTQASAVRILVARSALRIQGLFESVFVASIACKVCMPAAQVETGCGCMIVTLRLRGNGEIFSVPVDRVAGDAIGSITAVVARIFFNLFRNFRVALQASRCRKPSRLFVARAAMIRPVEKGMGCGKIRHGTAALSQHSCDRIHQQQAYEAMPPIDFASGAQTACTGNKSPQGTAIRSFQNNPIQ
jgi:hypothetical protein